MKVSAVIVTRGDVELGPILETFEAVPRIDGIYVWDNSRARRDFKVWGRHKAALLPGAHPVIYSQDDDLVHTPGAINRIIDSYRPGHIVGCMWPEWSSGAERQGIEGGYHDLVFPGSGSVYSSWVPLVAAARYLRHYPRDDFFETWCDAIIGVLAPTVALDERFELLPAARADNRLAAQPGAAAAKRMAIMRARLLPFNID